MKKCLWILALSFCTVTAAEGQTRDDSLAIVSARWNVVHTQDGITARSMSTSRLYGSNQVVSVLEIEPRDGLKVGIAVSDSMERTSRIAASRSALAAINGSYFDMKRGNSVCFLKTDRQIVDTTVMSEFALRVNGAVRERRGKMSIVPWSRAIEKKQGRKRGSAIASGPLLLLDGQTCGWSSLDKGFVMTRHPRSAVGTTEDGRVLFVAVAGRFKGRADGMSIPELAYLMHILGCRDALNLDGGGSTTLWMKGASDGGVVSYPTDNRRFDHEGERRVPNVIYIYK